MKKIILSLFAVLTLYFFIALSVRGEKIEDDYEVDIKLYRVETVDCNSTQILVDLSVYNPDGKAIEISRALFIVVGENINIKLDSVEISSMGIKSGFEKIIRNVELGKANVDGIDIIILKIGVGDDIFNFVYGYKPYSGRELKLLDISIPQSIIDEIF